MTAPFATMPDPPIRPDGACSVCGQPRVKGNVKPLYAQAAATDPFCSSSCARTWHGCPLPVAANKGGRPRGSARDIGSGEV